MESFEEDPLRFFRFDEDPLQIPRPLPFHGLSGPPEDPNYLN